MLQKLARFKLERSGFRVFTASRGDEALAVYQQHQAQIDLVFLDLTMPGMSGLDVLHNLQHINPGIRVIFTSGLSAYGEKEDLLAAGALAFVAKPYRPEELVGNVRQVLDCASALSPEYVEAGC
jgi:CheY-like chemotaxis protein